MGLITISRVAVRARHAPSWQVRQAMDQCPLRPDGPYL